MPLPNDDEEARKSRAARLRKQIDELMSAEPTSGSAAEKIKPAPPQSPRDFIHDKMSKGGKPRK